MRGPQRLAMSGSSSTTIPPETATSSSHPGRAASSSVVGLVPSLWARKITSGSCSRTYSRLSCGKPPAVSSTPSAMLTSPAEARTLPMNVSEVAECPSSLSS